MEYRKFSEIVAEVKKYPIKRRAVVAGAEDEHVLEAVFRAEKEGFLFPVLIGNKDKTARILSEMQIAENAYELCDESEPEKYGAVAVEYIKAGAADFIIKGKSETKDVLKPVVKKENGLHSGRLMSVVAMMQIPTYHKLVIISDGGMVIYPDLEAKKQILYNSVETLLKLGYEKPKAAVICAVETYNPNMRETVDAKALTDLNKSGEIVDCIVEGPISYDLAMSKESAQIKGYPSEHCGNFDVLLMPDLVCGNSVVKSLTVNAGAMMGGIVIGAKIPIVINSRGASAEEKFHSIALCSLVAAKN